MDSQQSSIDALTGKNSNLKKRFKQTTMLEFFKNISGNGDSLLAAQGMTKNKRQKDMTNFDKNAKISKIEEVITLNETDDESCNESESSNIKKKTEENAKTNVNKGSENNIVEMISGSSKDEKQKNVEKNYKRKVEDMTDVDPSIDKIIEINNMEKKITKESTKIDDKKIETENKTSLPFGYSEWLEKSVEKWSLQPPYSIHTADAWKRYYQERAALEWRSEKIWQENGEDCPGKCGEWYDPEKMPVWSLEWKQPRLKPCCAESYAKDCDSTDKEEYGELVDHIRRRVEATLSNCSKIPASMAKAAAGGAYILQYWINREDCAKDANVRSCHFENRFYVPIGTGDSYDLHYRHHYRERMYGNTEKFSDLFVEERSINECNPEDPTPIGDWYPAKCSRSKALDASMIKLLNQDGKKKATRTTQGVLKRVALRVLGGGKVTMSGRKSWELMARAGGMCAAGEGGNSFLEAKGKLGKLAKGEGTDEEEASGPQRSECTIA